MCLNLNDNQLKKIRYSYRSTYVNLIVTTNQEPTIYLHPEPHGLNPTIHVRPESSTTVSVCTCCSSREANPSGLACLPSHSQILQRTGMGRKAQGKPKRRGLRGFSSSLTWVRHSVKPAGRSCPQLAKFREHHLRPPCPPVPQGRHKVRNLRGKHRETLPTVSEAWEGSSLPVLST